MSAIIAFKKRRIEDTYPYGRHITNLKIKKQLKQMDNQAVGIRKKDIDRLSIDSKEKKGEWKVTDRYANVAILQLSETRAGYSPSISEMYNDLKSIPGVKVIMISKDYDQQKLLDKLGILIQLPTYLTGPV